jgi:Cu+-exporting ATPase
MTTDADARPPITTKRLIAIGVLGMALTGLIAVVAVLAAPAVFDRARPARTRVAGDGLQEITVEIANGVYAPNVLKAKAGVPLRLRVIVRDRHSCATKLLVPDLKLDFDLLAPGSVDLLVPAAKPGSYLFTCGMKMVKGTIVVE